MFDIIIPDLRFLEYKGRRIAYREKGKGPAILLFHGMNGNSRSWATLFGALGNQFRVIAWDAPSFGDSDVFGDTIDDYCNAAKALIKYLQIKDIIVIGHSMGGLIATKLAVDKDVSLAGLVLSSSHLGYGRPKGEALMARYADRIGMLSKKNANIEYGFERARRSIPNNTPNNIIEFLADIAKSSRIEGIRDGGRMSQETDNALICRRIKVPVVILSGGKDKIISTEMHNALVNAIPHAEQFIFSEAGHASYVEYPNLFQKHILDLAKTVWKIKYFSPEPNYFSNIQKEQ